MHIHMVSCPCSRYLRNIMGLRLEHGLLRAILPTAMCACPQPASTLFTPPPLTTNRSQHNVVLTAHHPVHPPFQPISYFVAHLRATCRSHAGARNHTSTGLPKPKMHALVRPSTAVGFLASGRSLCSERRGRPSSNY